MYPFEDGYWQSAMIARTIAMANGDGKKKYKIDDFLPDRRRQHGRVRRKQSVAEMKMMFMMTTAKGRV